MDSINASGTTAPKFRVLDFVLCGLLVGISVVVLGIASYFRLSPETVALRESVLSSVNGTWNKKIALNVGFFTTSLVRAGSHLFKMAPEGHAAFETLRGAEVGVYKLQGEAGWADHRAILTRADREMSARRWDRVVGVSREHELVAVYVPTRGVSSGHMRACVLVLQDRDLIVVGASGNLNPLLQLAQQHFDFKDMPTHFALR